MNDTPQGDGNIMFSNFIFVVNFIKIRMNDTPQGDGNTLYPATINLSVLYKNE